MLFLTAYDPLGKTAGSVDPLGALQSYGGLADLLLPSVTTITRRSRYLSMLCAALDNAERFRQGGFPPGPAGLPLRRKAIEAFERLWSLACVAARDGGNSVAADGLRGVTYAQSAWQQFTQQGELVTPDFKLLKYQERTGAIGTYWTVLVGGHLVDPGSGALLAEGRELAREFPSLSLADRDSELLADPARSHRVSLGRKTLEAWAESCHLGGAEKAERQLLAEALTADVRRDCLTRALRTYAKDRPLPSSWDIPSLRRIGQALAGDEQAKRIGLPVVVDGIVSAEQFHEAALAVFESALWWGTQYEAHPLSDLCADAGLREAAEATRSRADALLRFSSRCEAPEVKHALGSLLPFAGDLVRAQTPAEVLDEVLRRHHRVQSGKLDGGTPKRDWVAVGSGKVLRPAPRFQRTDRPQVPRGNRLTHPYRLEQFAEMLRENDALQDSATPGGEP